MIDMFYMSPQMSHASASLPAWLRDSPTKKQEVSEGKANYLKHIQIQRSSQMLQGIKDYDYIGMDHHK